MATHPLQAAIASIALDLAIERNSGEEDEMLGRQVRSLYICDSPNFIPSLKPI